MTNLTKKQIERLQPFLLRKGAAQKVGLFLLGAGECTVPDLVKMTVPQIRAMCLPVEIGVYVDEMLDDRKTGPAFQYSSGTVKPYTYWHRLVRTAAEKAVGRPMSAQQFRAYITKKGP